jgi:hypothetical protein
MRTRVFTLLSVVTLPAVAAAQAGPPSIHIAPVVPPAFRLLAEPVVQKEVGLTDAQKAAMDEIRRDWDVPARGLWFGYLGHVPGDVLRAAADERTANFLARGLTKDQRTRLDQIYFQLREKEFGPHLAFAMAARDLGLRPDQSEDVRTLKALRVEEIDKVVTSGKRFEKVKVEVQATNGDTFEKMAEMLTRTQRERLNELRGKLFEGKVELGEARQSSEKPRYPATSFGVYDLELWYIVAPTVRSELGLTDAQIKAFQAAYDEASEVLSAGKLQQVHALTEKAIADHLIGVQRARFDELMIQRRARVSAEAACGHPAAVAALKLTPIQLQQLRDGKPVPDVLTVNQARDLGRLAGKPFDLPTDVKDPYLPAAGQQAVVASRPALARDFLKMTERLKLSGDQVTRLRELAEDEPKIRELIRFELSLDDTPPMVGPARYLTAAAAVTEHYRTTVEQKCWDLLEPAQQSIARKLFGRGRN